MTKILAEISMIRIETETTETLSPVKWNGGAGYTFQGYPIFYTSDG